MKIAIVGSRDWRYPEQVALFLSHFTQTVVVVSGGAQGVDAVAERTAKALGMAEPEIHLPEWEKHGKSAGIIRNAEIIKSADVVAAFWDGKSRGTDDSIQRAKKAGKPLVVFTHPGSMEKLRHEAFRLAMEWADDKLGAHVRGAV